MNARELANRLRNCSLNEDTKFDRESGMWYDVGLVVVARPGSGKTWMMQQIVYFICEEYLTMDFDNPYRFVPVLFSVQRIARLYRKYCLSSARKDPIKSQTDALELLEVILRWDYDDDPTVDAILECYSARTLVILLDGLDEASSIANVFESFGVFLAKSGNRVVMAARPEGIKNQEFYSKREGWTLLDLPELSVEQQATIAHHQIDNCTAGSFFNQFYQFQDSRNALDAAADKCLVDEGELGVILSGIKLTKMELVPKAVLNCNTLSEVGLIFNEEEDFCLQQQNVIDPSHKEVLQCMKDLYDRATVDKLQLDGFLDTLFADLQIASVVKAPLKKPKQLLQNAARNNGLHNVTAVEGFVVCDDWTQMKTLLKYIADSKSIGVHHIHNGFQDLDFIHYRYLSMTVFIETSSHKNCLLKLPSCDRTHLVVIQIHLLTMYELLPSCEGPRNFFLEQGGVCGDDVQRMEDLKKRMDVVHAIGRTPVLLSVFLMFIRACTSRLSREERDETVDVQTCPPMPPSLHYLYQEALWGALEARENSSSALLEVLERVAFENMKHGPITSKLVFPGFIFKMIACFNVCPTDNRREFSIYDVHSCGLLSVWPEADHIPFIKIVEGTDKSLSNLEGLYQFAHLSFQGMGE